LLLASLVLGGKDTDSGDGGHDTDGDLGLAWAPVASLRFWVFLLAFGGGAGLALGALGSSTVVTAIGAGVIGWVAGAVAVAVVRSVSKNSASSEVKAGELVGLGGTLTLPIGKDRPGKVRVELKGRAEDYVAALIEDDQVTELPTGTPVLIVAEGERGSLLVAKAEM
jgi:hypothetical protein